MLVFLIHGVATQDAGYGDKFKKKIKEILIKKTVKPPIFYSSFWGHKFKSKTDQLFNWVRSDIKDLSDKCRELRGSEADIYRYQEYREDFIPKFFGDFLTYLSTDKGPEIRKQILNQFQDFVNSHPEEKEITIVAHSLGTLILWDLLFDQGLSENDPAKEFRRLFDANCSNFKLCGIVTMGSPLLFMGIKQNIDFSAVDDFILKHNPRLGWINIIHASDVIAYPLGNAIKHDKVKHLSFTDQYLWEHANVAESGALRLGQSHAAMALGMADAHGSYWNNDISADLVSSLLRGHLTTLATQQVHTGWRSYSKDLPKNSSGESFSSPFNRPSRSSDVSQAVEVEREIAVSVKSERRSVPTELPIVCSSTIDTSQNEDTIAHVFDKVRKIISDQFDVDESQIYLTSHLFNDLGAKDFLDFLELSMALEEEFDIEISDSESENVLGIKDRGNSHTPNASSPFSGGFLSSIPSSDVFFEVHAGDNCVVRSFVDLIHKKIYG